MFRSISDFTKCINNYAPRVFAKPLPKEAVQVIIDTAIEGFRCKRTKEFLKCFSEKPYTELKEPKSEGIYCRLYSKDNITAVSHYYDKQGSELMDEYDTLDIFFKTISNYVITKCILLHDGFGYDKFFYDIEEVIVEHKDDKFCVGFKTLYSEPVGDSEDLLTNVIDILLKLNYLRTKGVSLTHGNPQPNYITRVDDTYKFTDLDMMCIDINFTDGSCIKSNSFFTDEDDDVMETVDLLMFLYKTKRSGLADASYHLVYFQISKEFNNIGDILQRI